MMQQRDHDEAAADPEQAAEGAREDPDRGEADRPVRGHGAILDE